MAEGTINGSNEKTLIVAQSTHIATPGTTVGQSECRGTLCTESMRLAPVGVKPGRSQ